MVSRRSTSRCSFRGFVTGSPHGTQQTPEGFETQAADLRLVNAVRDQDLLDAGKNVWLSRLMDLPGMIIKLKSEAAMFVVLKVIGGIGVTALPLVSKQKLPKGTSSDAGSEELFEIDTSESLDAAEPGRGRTEASPQKKGMIASLFVATLSRGQLYMQHK